MDEINVKAKWGGAIQKLWETSPQNIPEELKGIIKRDLFVQDRLSANGIVFIGIGASWDDSGDTKIQDTSMHIKNVWYETEKGRQENAYYRPLNKIAEEAGLAPSYIDITMLRETKQDTVEQFFKKIPDFMQKQYDIALAMIKECAPRVIVVNNAFISRLLNPSLNPPQRKETFDLETGFKSEFDKKTGTDKIIEPHELAGTPVFYSGMLSGQHALDLGSRKRLSWHIQRVLK
jgi:hypothetical protein